MVLLSTIISVGLTFVISPRCAPAPWKNPSIDEFSNVSSSWRSEVSKLDGSFVSAARKVPFFMSMQVVRVVFIEAFSYFEMLPAQSILMLNVEPSNVFKFENSEFLSSFSNNKGCLSGEEGRFSSWDIDGFEGFLVAASSIFLNWRKWHCDSCGNGDYRKNNWGNHSDNISCWGSFFEFWVVAEFIFGWSGD